MSKKIPLISDHGLAGVIREEIQKLVALMNEANERGISVSFNIAKVQNQPGPVEEGVTTYSFVAQPITIQLSL